VAISPDGNTAYVANAGTSDSVSVLDTATNTVTDNILVGIGNTPYAVAVSPGGSHVYVAIGDTNTVSVIDTATNTVTDWPSARTARSPTCPTTTATRCRYSHRREHQGPLTENDRPSTGMIGTYR